MVKHITKRLIYERIETIYRSASDREVEAQSCFKLTLEYCLSRAGRMHSERSSNRKREGRRATGNTSAWESVIQPGRWRDKRTSSAVLIDSDKDKDLIELINDQSDMELAAATEMPLVDAAVLVNGGYGETESPTKGLNSGHDSSNCSMDALCSGPSSPKEDPDVGRSYAQGLCLCCQTLLKRATHSWPLKAKLLETDPKSLSCDQWVLKKRWKSSGRPVLKSKLQGCLKRIQRSRSDVYNVMQGQPACSRAHTFLQRNLRRCTKASARRGRKRKRTSRRMEKTTTMGKRARCDPHQKEPSPTAPHGQSVDNSSPLDSLSEEEDAEAQDSAHSSLEAVPSLVAIDFTVDQKAGASKGGPAKRGGFKDLLIQLRGNSSKIVRETDHH
ncbi:uncharacterized protein si:ch211-227n13.3 isoform X1 [Gadus macrocephalus]|uniref:uncharacterized protein si:ch211-227n13.3 isoform X1 n=2 Tax=Gadus macrocephalus TaxID=80720 RepID=UPI0028CB6056|nr:uncharacterized protein si:ch211-227n13.3 isoform X1 [Gadus macrocephalus]